ncbi:hypothetical protein [Sorangium cellulosum]|uniref:hypothetical protein n=1 Tax=Sorangium cellulosum TaxID=56 RepID=UPI000A61E7F6|nr:hypothetical protein [Sorangium cellulosum]
MKSYRFGGLACIVLGAFGCGAAERPGDPEAMDGVRQALHDTTAVFAYVDMMSYELKFYEPSLDMEASVDLRTLPGYGSGVPLHAYITEGGHKVYVGFNGDASSPTGLAVIRVNDIFWHEHAADVELVKKLILDDPAHPHEFPAVTQVDPRQPFQPWTAQPFTQLHGPAELFSKHRLFWTVLTDDRVVTVNTSNDTLLPTQEFGDASRALHGISFNAAETRGLGAGYFYDRGYLPVFSVQADGTLASDGEIWLGTPKSHAAFVHNVEWQTNRYAFVGTMQFARTSLTPSSTEILGPSVWYVDTKVRIAKRIIKPTTDVNGAGIFRSASWVEVVGDKLFVGEEDSLDDSFGDDGYVSVFDVKDPWRPRFIKRLKPGVELPADFAVGHALAPTPDGKSVILESYPSGYVLRIGTESLLVEHVIHHDTMHSMPHGGSIVGIEEGHDSAALRTSAFGLDE